MAAHSCTSFRFADSVLHPATVRANRPRAPTLAVRILPPGKSQLRMGWNSNPRNGYPFTRSPGACLQPLGHLSTSNWFNGWGGIRTHDALTGIPVFETGSFSHSDTHPDSVNKQRVPFSPRRLPSEP